MRSTAGANAWREVERVKGDRRVSHKSKGNVFGSCVIPAYMNALETMALTDKQLQKVKVCENNLVCRIDGIKRAY